MNCSKIKRLLPEFLTGDLLAADELAVRKHLDECGACRDQHQMLQRILQTLNSLPHKQAQVEFPKLYEQAATRQRRQLQRWRRCALAVGAIAAGLLVLALFKWEVTVEQHQFVLRWGLPADKSSATNPDRNPEFNPHFAESKPQLTADVTLNKKLIHALAARIESIENDNDGELGRLRDEVARLRLITDGRWTDSQRQFRVLYTAQFGSANEGGIP